MLEEEGLDFEPFNLKVIKIRSSQLFKSQVIRNQLIDKLTDPLLHG